MPPKLRFAVAGVPEVVRDLTGFKVSIRNRVLRGAMTKATRRVARVAKDLAPEGETKALKRSVGQKVVVRRRVIGIVGPRRGFRVVTPDGVPHDPAVIAHLAERGRKALVPVKKKVLSLRFPGGLRIAAKRVRAAQGSRFLARAYSRTKAEVRELIAADVAERVAKLRR